MSYTLEEGLSFLLAAFGFLILGSAGLLLATLIRDAFGYSSRAMRRNPSRTSPAIVSDMALANGSVKPVLTEKVPAIADEGYVILQEGPYRESPVVQEPLARES
ncbi:MAG TPA: hypothetical protein VMP68_24800 [Candidatus Eisenbacteria bacterium]|nr:hypothetical protein [Candidatus Eisenbacteria bacterium]